jgi:hypothetical protein
MNPIDRIKSPLKLQDTMANGRVCEWQALAQVCDAIDAVVYLTVGNDERMGALAIEHNYKKIDSICVADTSEENLALIKSFHDLSPGRALYYVNDRNKMDTLKALVDIIPVGSVLGVHDWGTDKMTIAGTYTEVPEKRLGFIYSAGFEVFKPIASWVAKHKCTQKFWLRTNIYGGYYNAL